MTTDLSGVADNVRDGLVQRGFAPDSVEILKAQNPDDRVTTARIRQSLKKQASLTSKDEFWLILLGFSARNDEGAPAFQVSGPRLSAADLKAALDSIPARQFVFVGTSDSGAFVPILLSKNRSVLAATREEGEIDLPRFPDSWAQALKENPRADWNKIAARAAELTEKTYTDNNLAESEHARLGDPETGQILEAPFGADALAQPAAPAAPSGPTTLLSASDIKVEIHKPNAEWEKQAATAETKKLIAEARATPNPEGFSSILLEQRLGYRVGEDRTAEDFVLRRIYIAKEDGVARWANFMLPQDPPAVTTKLEAARIIQPDGSSTVFNPAKMPPATDPSSDLAGAFTMIFMPDAHAGCLIEIAYRTDHLLDASVPNFSEELPVQQDIPTMQTELQLQIPEKMGLHFKLRLSDQKSVESVSDGVRTISWKLGAIPAYEALPYDPPERDMVMALDISSLNSWDDFATWYRRLARGSDIQDDTVRAKAQELASGATSRLDKIRKAYEFVSALRYVAIEFGINGIRPRTPALVLQNRYGDCKDKANLLVALLADMGIDGRFCLLNRGSSTDITFPSWQFNHAIAYVPKAPGQPNDLWLDTTDSTAPFPTLSPGDIGRAALVFNPDSAQFFNVTMAGKEVTELKEDWDLQEKSDGSWHGALRDTWSGLAEYGIRSSVRGLSPRQRDYAFQTKLNRQLDDADFTHLELTPADDLSIPLSLIAQVDAPSLPNPRPGFEIESYFASPARDHPLLINNGQKLHLTQRLDLVYDHGTPANAPPSFDETSGGFHARTVWERRNDHAWERTMELDVTDPLVPPADYPALRKMLRQLARANESLIEFHSSTKTPMTTPDLTSAQIQLLTQVKGTYQSLAAELKNRIIGQDEIVRDLFVALMVQGHVLMIGVPGLAKTLIVRSLAEILDLSFQRIQFTPDLMPSDVTGTEILEESADGKREFRFVPGPVFANLLLADEINRTPPKTQASLLEAMQEQRVTVAGNTYVLPAPFFVLATQNPIEQEGTYPLPEAQMDRFMFNLRVDYPSRADEIQILQETTRDEIKPVKKILNAQDLLALQHCVKQIPVPPSVAEYAVDLVQSTRPMSGTAPDSIKKYIQWGAGPRASQYLALAGKALAVLDGRFNVAREDIATSAKLVLRHRMITNYRAEADQVTVDDLIDKLVASAK